MRATRELAQSTRNVERLALLQEERARPIFTVQDAYAVAGFDGNAYVHFHLVNSGWKDCAIGSCVLIAKGPEGQTSSHELSLVEKNQERGTVVKGGVAQAQPAWIPQHDFMVVAGGRRRLSARGRIAAAFDAKKGWTSTLRVTGVLDVADEKAIDWRERTP